jgi:hypothetical protein
MEDGPRDETQSDKEAGREISDLIGIELVGSLAIWLLLVLVGFFLIGPVAGIVLLLAGVIVYGGLAFSALRRADISD